MTLLVVEDNAVSARVTSGMLRSAGYDIKVVESAEAALEAMKSAMDLELILTDIRMPGMDGLSFLSLLKESPALRNVPVIMLTSKSDADTVRQAFKLGCSGFIVKPVRKDILVRKVKEALDRERLALVSRQEQLDELGIDPVMYKQLIQAFKTQIRQKVTLIESYLHGTGEEPDPERDFQDIEESAVVLGGSRLLSALKGLASMEASGEEYELNEALSRLLNELRGYLDVL